MREHSETQERTAHQREKLTEVSQVYITKSEFGNMKEQIIDINKKLDKIYDTLINERSSDGIN